MRKVFYLASLITAFGFTEKQSSALSHNQSRPINYLNLPERLEFNSQQFGLTSSVKPNDFYFKQEYIPKGEDIDKFSNILFVDAIVSDTLTVKDIMSNKVSELELQKRSNPVINYKVYNNRDSSEYIIDFLLSNNADDNPTVMEWNCYRIKAFLDKNGHKGVMLLAISRRAYENRIEGFLKELREKRLIDIAAMRKYIMPEVTIPNE